MTIKTIKFWRHIDDFFSFSFHVKFEYPSTCWHYWSPPNYNLKWNQTPNLVKLLQVIQIQVLTWTQTWKKKSNWKVNFILGHLNSIKKFREKSDYKLMYSQMDWVFIFRLQCGNYGNLLLHTFFCKNFVNSTIFLKNLLNSWFDEIFFRWD